MPLSAHTSAQDHRQAFVDALHAIERRFLPDLIIISAGFDAHEGDPLGQLLLTNEDFIEMTRAVKQWAKSVCAGRIISSLEGGYNLGTLGNTVRAHVRELMEE